MGLSMAQKKAVSAEMAKRYRRATKRTKAAMIDELAALTGWSRRNARRRLTAGADPPQPKRCRSAVRIYDDEVLGVLRRLWALAGGPCGKRLAPFLGEFVDALVRYGELKISSEVRCMLTSMSASTVDRAMAPERKRLQVKGRSGTKPGSMLKSQIPIRTFAEWDDARPGFVEVDLVGHDGGNLVGEYCQTLDLTDVSSGWTAMRAVQNKAQVRVHAALEHIVAGLPFPLAGLDSDNGSEFINEQLFTWCATNQITFTRSRPYRKNDNCFVEQKNWTHVRQAVGYARFDTPAELECLNQIYEVWMLWVNYFSPQMRLVSKTRNGAKVSRRYDIAATPYQRLLASEHIGPKTKAALRRRYRELNPGALSREIGRLQKRLIAIHARKHNKKEVKPAADHPWRANAATKRNAGMRPTTVRQRKGD